MVKPPSLTGLMPKLATQGCRQRGSERERGREGGGRGVELYPRGAAVARSRARYAYVMLYAFKLYKSRSVRDECAHESAHTYTHRHTQPHSHTGTHALDPTHTQIHILFYYSCAFFYFTLLYFTSCCCFFRFYFNVFYATFFPCCCCCCCLYFSHLVAPRTKQKATPAQDQRISVCEPVALSRHRQCFRIVQ